MYLAVKDVKAMDNYKLILTFEFKDKNLFKTVKVSFDTIEWSNGADIDPETLYEDSHSLS